jgi:F-type H+-transporting ATPase subunit a
VEQHFNWLDLIPGLKVEEYNHVVMAIVTIVLVTIGALFARIQLGIAKKREDEGLVPDSKLTFRNLFEIIAEKIYGLAVNVMGKHNTEKHFPLVGALFIFIFTSNLIGLIPGIVPATENMNTTLALGVFVFIYYTLVGFIENGFGYLKHFMGPVWWLAPLMFVIELASHLSRPLSLGLRLRGNIMGDHIVLGVFHSLFAPVVPAVFFGVGLFVALIQAFVFCLMTMVYISLSASHDH